MIFLIALILLGKEFHHFDENIDFVNRTVEIISLKKEIHANLIEHMITNSNNNIVFLKSINHDNLIPIRLNHTELTTKIASMILAKNNFIISENATTILNIKLSDEMIFCPIGYNIIKENNHTDIIAGNNISLIIALRNFDISKTGHHCNLRDIIDYERIKKNNLWEYLNENEFEIKKIEFNISINSTSRLNNEIITLNMYKYTPIISDRLRNILNYTPVIFGTGLWSNIDSAKNVPEHISARGFETYKIELTGSQYIECDSCLNYNFSTIIKSFLPAYINKIESTSGKREFTYIGHSNGCRSIIYYLFERKDPRIKNLIGNACPTEFDGNNKITELIKIKSEDVIENFKTRNLTHITFSDVKDKIIDLPLNSVGKEKISINLLQDYFNAINHIKTNKTDFSRIIVENLLIIYGELIPRSDGIVFITDPIILYTKINAKNKEILMYPIDHITIAEDKKVINDILLTLEKWNR